VLDSAVAARHAGLPGPGAIFVSGGPNAARSLDRYAAGHPGVSALSRSRYLHTLRSSSQENVWLVWLVVGLAVVFGTLALVNTAAMATAERRSELATIRILGGTPGQAVRMIALELVPTIAVALLAGFGLAAVSVMGVPRGVTGIPLVVPVAITGALGAGSALLGLVAGGVSARLALRASPAGAMRDAT
jgi:putative ABC transport system permease protein